MTIFLATAQEYGIEKILSDRALSDIAHFDLENDAYSLAEKSIISESEFIVVGTNADIDLSLDKNEYTRTKAMIYSNLRNILSTAYYNGIKVITFETATDSMLYDHGYSVYKVRDHTSYHIVKSGTKLINVSSNHNYASDLESTSSIKILAYAYPSLDGRYSCESECVLIPNSRLIGFKWDLKSNSLAGLDLTISLIKESSIFNREYFK